MKKKLLIGIGIGIAIVIAMFVFVQNSFHQEGERNLKIVKQQLLIPPNLDDWVPDIKSTQEKDYLTKLHKKLGEGSKFPKKETSNNESNSQDTGVSNTGIKSQDSEIPGYVWRTRNIESLESKEAQVSSVSKEETQNSGASNGEDTRDSESSKEETRKPETSKEETREPETSEEETREPETSEEETREPETSEEETREPETSEEETTEPETSEEETREPETSEEETTEPEPPELIQIDTSNWKFERVEAVYDGKEHTALVTGLPDYVVPVYVDNKRIDAGTSIAKVSFEVPEEYAVPKEMETEIVIQKATIPAIKLDKMWMLTNIPKGTITITPPVSVPKGVICTYEVNGESPKTSYVIKDSGIYSVVANFTLTEQMQKNYMLTNTSSRALYQVSPEMWTQPKYNIYMSELSSADGQKKVEIWFDQVDSSFTANSSQWNIRYGKDLELVSSTKGSSMTMGNQSAYQEGGTGYGYALGNHYNFATLQTLVFNVDDDAIDIVINLTNIEATGSVDFLKYPANGAGIVLNQKSNMINVTLPSSSKMLSSQKNLVKAVITTAVASEEVAEEETSESETETVEEEETSESETETVKEEETTESETETVKEEETSESETETVKEETSESETETVKEEETTESETETVEEEETTESETETVEEEETTESETETVKEEETSESETETVKEEETTESETETVEEEETSESETI